LTQQLADPWETKGVKDSLPNISESKCVIEIGQLEGDIGKKVEVRKEIIKIQDSG